MYSKRITRLSPLKEVNYKIDLMPRETPISKAPYQLGTNELGNLKMQLQELLDKWIHTPSASPWGAPCCLSRRKMEHLKCALIIDVE
jgi:hypothetical protein